MSHLMYYLYVTWHITASYKILSVMMVLRRQLFMLHPKPHISLCHEFLVYKRPSPTSTTESDLGFMGLSSVLFKVAIGKLWPMGQIGPFACFVNKV